MDKHSRIAELKRAIVKLESECKTAHAEIERLEALPDVHVGSVLRYLDNHLKDDFLSLRIVCEVDTLITKKSSFPFRIINILGTEKGVFKSLDEIAGLSHYKVEADSIADYYNAKRKDES